MVTFKGFDALQAICVAEAGETEVCDFFISCVICLERFSVFGIQLHSFLGREDLVWRIGFGVVRYLKSIAVSVSRGRD